MAYRVGSGGASARESGPGHTDPTAAGSRPSRPSPANDPLSWIRALASQWEDEQSQPHAPGLVLDSDRDR